MPTRRQGDEWLTGFVPYLLYRITNQLNRRMRERLRRSHINVGRWRVLAVLQAHGKSTMTEIVEATVMEQPTVSRIVAQLAAEGLVERQASARDSRVVNVSLTAAGEAAFREIYPIAVDHQSRTLRGFSAREIGTLRDYLARIDANIRASDT